MLALHQQGCTAACAREFSVCVSEGPGYATCVQELTDGTAPLAGSGNPCVQGCTMTAEMTALGGGGNAAACSAACETEFLTCCNEGPGYDQCVVELRGATGPLSGPCADDCTLTPTMEAQNATANVCSAACANEFVVHCLPHHSPNGCSQCRSEINSQTGPLATVCAANCVDTASMTTACSSG